MSTFKATNKKKKREDDVFKATSRKTYDSALVSSWERDASVSFGTLKNYLTKMDNGEYLSSKDLEDYKSAMERYIDKASRLRGINKSLGNSYSEEEEKEWLDSVNSLKTGYEHNSKVYSSYKNEKEYKKALEAIKTQDAMKTEDVKLGMAEVDSILNSNELTSLKAEKEALEKGIKLYHRDSGTHLQKLGYDKKTADKRLSELGEQISNIEEPALKRKDYLTQAQYLQNYYHLTENDVSLEEIESHLNDADPIAYTSPEGKNVTWQYLYDHKYGEEDLNTRYEEYSKRDDWEENSKVKDTKNLHRDQYYTAVASSGDGFAPVALSASDVMRIYWHTTDEEKQVYLYLYNTEGAVTANEWIKSRDFLFQERSQEAQDAKWASFAKNVPVISDIVSIPMSLLGGLEYLGNVITGDADKTVQLSRAASTIRNTRMEQVNLEIAGWDAFDFVYGTGMSAADSLSAAAVFAPLGAGGAVASKVATGASSLTLGLSAAAQGTNEALERGLTGKEAFMHGFMSGVFEGVFESVSIGQFSALKNSLGTGVKNIAKNIGKSMLVNASEETLTELANIAYDNLANADFSQYETMVRTYVMQGMSVEQAEAQATRDVTRQVVESAASGALMGLGFGSVGSISSNAKAKRIESSFDSDSINALIGEGLSVPGSEAYKLAQAAQAKINSGGSLSAQELVNLQNANEKAFRGNDTSKMTSAAEARLTALGETGDVSTLAKIIAKQASGQKLSASEKTALKNSKYGQRVVNELSPENIASGQYASDWAENIGTDRINTDAYNGMYALAREIVAPKETAVETEAVPKTSTGVSAPYSAEYVENLAKEYEAKGYSSEEAKIMAVAQLSATDQSKSAPTIENAVEGKYEVADDGKTSLKETGEAVEIINISSISESGEANLTINDGMVVKASDLAFGSPIEATFIENIGKIKIGNNPINTNSANSLYMTAMSVLEKNPNMTASEAMSIIKGLEESYIYGAYNFGRSKLTATNKDGKAKHFAGELSQTQRKFAYDLGAKDSRSKVESKQKAIDDLKAKAKTKVTNKSNGKVIFEDGAVVDESALTKTQKANLNGIKLLAELSSIEFHVFRSKKVGKTFKYTMPDGTVVSANGWYVAGTNEIWVDLNAGNAGEGTMIRTAAHEISHYIKQWSPAKWQAMADLLLESFAKNGIDTEAMLRRQMDKIERRYTKKNMPSESVIRDMAYEELVSDALTDMLTDGSIVNFIADVKLKDANLAKRILNAIKNLLKKWGLIIEDYKGRNLDTAEAQALSQLEDTFKKLQEMYRDAFMDANETFATIGEKNEQKNTTSEGDVKYMARDEGDTSIKEQIKSNQDLLSSMDVIASLDSSKTFAGKQDAISWAMEQLENTGFKVKRDGFGEILIDKKRLQKGYRYLKTNEEKLAYALIPEVLRKGEKIGYHPKHKGREYDTTTFAAPVEINGYRGNMAVVVRQEDKNYYKVHRLLLPDGSQFVFNEKGDKAERAGQENNLDLSPTDNVSIDSIPQTSKKSQVKLSDRDVDTYERIHEMQAEVNRLGKAIEEIESNKDFKTQLDSIFSSNDDMEVKISKYQKLLDESEYGKLKNKRDALQLELENLRKSVEENRLNKALAEEKEAIAKSGLSEADYFRKQAVKEFGYTPYFYDAGYIVPNGRMLNFSGEKGKHFGSRGEDHRAIGRLYANSQGSAALTRFMNDGNIRIMAESPGIDVSAQLEPTNEQYSTIRKFVYEYAKEGFFNVDISDESGKVIGSLEYENNINPTRIINDIKHYYATGEIRQQSDVSKFLYSDRDLAPTFYSKMGKVIDEVKQEKLGANSVVNMLVGKGVKAEEIKWSGIESFLEGKKSVTKAELQEFIAGSMLQIEESVKSTDTNWGQYKLEGGKNYREVLFKMPNSNYSNGAMRGHWNGEKGILAHARIQDFDVNGKKMLFIEEIQSDWHNKGHKVGYAKNLSQTESKRISELNKIQVTLVEQMQKKYQKGDIDGAMELHEQERKLYLERKKIEGNKNGVPDAPFKDNYHEFVLKRLLRMAAEQGYDSIGWTPAEIQSERWSDEFAEGYRIEYDQDMPKFLKKYGRQWGATVGTTKLNKTLFNKGTEVWSMDITDSMRDSVLYEGQVMYSERDSEDAKAFARDIDRWNRDERPNDESFILGSTGDVLQGLGAIESDIYMLGEKINEILSNHPEMTLDEIKKIPQILENPILILKSRGEGRGNRQNTRLVIFGSVKAKDNRPILSILDLRPQEDNLVIDDMQKVTSAYTKDNNPVDFVRNSDVLYADKNKTTKLLRTIGFQMPIELQLSGYIGSISYKGQNVNIEGKSFSNVFKENTDPDIRNSDRDPDTSNRSILANSLESAAQNDIERNKLAEYKKKISLIESEEQRLAEIQKQLFTKGGVEPEQRKELQFEAKQISNRINTYDRQLLNLEATAALKNVLNREKALATKRQKQKDKEALNRYKERVAKTQRELLERHQESRKKAIEGRERTAIRHKIKTVVGDLNNLLLKPTKERHVPEEMKIAVAEALEIVNMDTVDAETRAAKYNDLIAKAKDPDVIASLTETRDRILKQGAKLADKLTKLKDAYGMVRDSADDSVRSMYDDVIYNKIESVQRTVGKTPLRNMTLGQLESVYDLYRMVLTTVRDSNKAFVENIKETRLALGSNTFAEIKENNKARDAVKHPSLEKFMWQNLKPMQAIKTIGSGTLSKLWNNVLYGQETFARDYDEAVKFAKEMKEKYGYKTWSLDKLYSFESKSGKALKLNLEQMMSIYAYSKRAQADEHIEYGGIVLNEGVIKVKNKLGKTVEVKVNDSTAYRLDKTQVGEIIATLEKEFPGAKGFVDEMQKYLSETMGEKGNEVAMKMYGIKLFKEEHYFPLKSSKDFMEAANAKLKGDVKIKNKGMTKAVVEHARNPIVLEGFLDVWGNHVNEMAMYHGLVLPLEDFSRTLNYSFKADETLNTDAESVRTALHDAFGECADNYLNELLKAINGGVLHDSSAEIADKMISKFKKAKVMASLSVIIQQPTAIIRSMGIIEPKYFIHQSINHKKTWEELKKYCPTAIIKETGSFDTNMGKTIVDMIKEDDTFVEKVGDTLGKAPAYMDEIGWNCIWRALKKKIATEQKLSGEELLQECGKQMTLILNETQVYDSTMSRNELMRSKNALTKMATAFMAEPTTVANMIYGAVLDFKRGKKGMAGKVVAAVVSSVVINGLVSSLVYALRDDDDDETILEKYISSATTEVLDGLNPLTYIPFIKDAYSLFQGYDVERTDMAIIGDVVDAVNTFYDVLDPEAYEGMSRKQIASHIYENTKPLLTSICDMFGLPVGNVMRDVEAIIMNNNAPISQTSPLGAKYAFKDGYMGALPKIVQKVIGTESKQDKLYDAIVGGDATYLKRLKSDYKDDKSYETAVRKALRENDSRIRKAAEARMNGEVTECFDIVDEVVGEGNFSRTQVIKAVNSELEAIKKKGKEKKEK